MSAAELTAQVAGKPTKFSYDKETAKLSVSVANAKALEVPLRNVLWAQANASSNGLRVSALVIKGSAAVLTHWDGSVTGDAAAAETWAAGLVDAAYGAVQPRRKFRVFVNPAGGQGYGRVTWDKKVKPVFDAAHVQVEVTITERGGHAAELVQDMALEFDAILAVSGDGLLHEILNGLAKRPDARKALRTPVAPIPTGSGNGFSVSLLGLKEGLDPLIAALNTIKGQPMDIDLCAFTQKDRTVYSFMSQATGLMADCDLGTENLRWMGNARFMYGFLKGLVAFKACPIELSINVSESDKKKMHETHRAIKSQHVASASRPNLFEAGEEAELPALRFGDGPDSDWITFEKPVLYVYAGKVPYVSADLCQFPIVRPNDGLIDLVVQERSNRGEVVKAIGVAPTGGQYWIESQHYFKVHAYRAKPLGPGYLSVDGEAFPFEEFQVEAHTGLAATLSMLGHYAVDF